MLQGLSIFRTWTTRKKNDSKMIDPYACLSFITITRLQKWRNRNREEEEDLAFPDEIDTPQDQAARVRFQRYRGLVSFRTSPWDPFENLPRDYARIFQFEDFKRTERTIHKRAEAEVHRVEVCLIST